MDQKRFTNNEAISYGWEKAKANVGLFVISFLIFIGVALLGEVLDGPDKELAEVFSLRANVVGFIFALISMVMQIGLTKMTLKIHDNEKTDAGELFRNYAKLWDYFLASIIYGLIIFVGFLLLIVPGVIWSLKFRFYSYFIIDKNMSPIEALKASAAITDGYKAQLFMLGILVGLINFLGLLCLGVGLFLTIPLSLMAFVFAFRRLQAPATDNATITPPVSPAPSAPSTPTFS
jgi:hypothetical protein